MLQLSVVIVAKKKKNAAKRVILVIFAGFLDRYELADTLLLVKWAFLSKLATRGTECGDAGGSILS
jgi:hypothetical protein